MLFYRRKRREERERRRRDALREGDIIQLTSLKTAVSSVKLVVSEHAASTR